MKDRFLLCLDCGDLFRFSVVEGTITGIKTIGRLATAGTAERNVETQPHGCRGE